MALYPYRKRGRDTLTGGTKDVNPQYMHLTMVQSADDTTTTTAFPIPIQRLQNAGRAQVMEVIKVIWDNSLNPAVITSDYRAFLSTSSSGTTAQTAGNTRVFDWLSKIKVAVTAAGIVSDEGPVIHDLTDGAGHGFLIATDNIFMQIVSAATSGPLTQNCKILYRWKDVSTIEYVGIVQGQQ